jgi:hypothetical protein
MHHQNAEKRDEREIRKNEKEKKTTLIVQHFMNNGSIPGIFKQDRVD